MRLQNLKTCFHCEHLPDGCNPCACLRDGRAPEKHAEANYCPEKFYGDGVAPADWGSVPVLRNNVPPPISLVPGPGDVIKFVLGKLGYNGVTDCGCEAFRQQMNSWNYAGCIVHFPEILAWFRQKAEERQIKLSAWGLWKELRRAWKAQRAARE